MADNLREEFEKALAKEPANAFHIAFKAGFRLAELKDVEWVAAGGRLQPATDVEIRHMEETALYRQPLDWSEEDKKKFREIGRPVCMHGYGSDCKKCEQMVKKAKAAKADR